MYVVLCPQQQFRQRLLHCASGDHHQIVFDAYLGAGQRWERKTWTVQFDLGGMIRDDVRHGSAAHHRSSVHDRQLVAQGLGFVEVVRRQHDGDARRFQVSNQLPSVTPTFGVQSSSRFVEEQYEWPADDRARQIQSPGLTSREELHAGITTVTHVHALEHLVHGQRIRAGSGPHRQTLTSSQVLGQATLLEHDAKRRANLLAVAHRIHAQNAHRSGTGSRKALNHFESGCLAGTVCSEEAEQLAFLNTQIQIANSIERLLAGAVTPRHSDYVDHGIALHRCASARFQPRSPIANRIPA